LVPLRLVGVFLWEGSARIGRRRLHWAAASAKVISMAVPALVAFLHLFLLCLRPLATVGAVVPAGSTVGAPVVFAFVQGRWGPVG